MRLRALVLVSLLISPLTAHAQSEAALKEYFEGRTVKLKLAMPGTEDGVDVYRHGQAVRRAPRTKREQNLEAELKREQDPVRRRAMREELDDLKARRAREDARNRASVAEAQETRKANIRQRRLEGGSRFNIRYQDGVPATATTPEAIKQTLAAYVDFDESAPAPTEVTSALPVAGSVPVGKPGPGGLPAKGMLQADVDELLGTPKKTSDRMEGRLKVTTRVYPTSAGQVTAEFVEGVLIRFSMTSN